MFLYHAYQDMHVLSFNTNGMIVAWAKHSMHNLNLEFTHVELLLFHVVQHIDLYAYYTDARVEFIGHAQQSAHISPRKT